MARQLKAIKKNFFFLFVLFCFSCTSAPALVEVRFDNPDASQSQPFYAELAFTESMRSFGLMYRKQLDDNQAMLFLFPTEKQREFWMKNTYLELDIIFLDKNFSVLNIAEKTTPLSTTAIPSVGQSLYVLEIKGGLARKNGISKGSKALIKGNLPRPN